jgi:hypothetical protein
MNGGASLNCNRRHLCPEFAIWGHEAVPEFWSIQGKFHCYPIPFRPSARLLILFHEA